MDLSLAALIALFILADPWGPPMGQGGLSLACLHGCEAVIRSQPDGSRRVL